MNSCRKYLQNLTLDLRSFTRMTLVNTAKRNKITNFQTWIHVEDIFQSPPLTWEVLPECRWSIRRRTCWPRRSCALWGAWWVYSGDAGVVSSRELRPRTDSRRRPRWGRCPASRQGPRDRPCSACPCPIGGSRYAPLSCVGWYRSGWNMADPNIE